MDAAATPFPERKPRRRLQKYTSAPSANISTQEQFQRVRDCFSPPKKSAYTAFYGQRGSVSTHPWY